MQIVTTYEPVRLQGVKSLPCPVCGKKLRRQRTFQQTLNPWNRNSDGTPKTRRQIQESLRERVTAWQGEPETHSACAS